MVEPGSVRQGEVYWIDFGEPAGSEAGYLRPAVVVQSDLFNSTAIRTALVCPLTSRLSRAGMPGTAILRSAETGLPRDSVAIPTSLQAANLSDFVEYVGRIPGQKLKEVRDGAALVLGIRASR